MFTYIIYSVNICYINILSKCIYDLYYEIILIKIYNIIKIFIIL